MSESEPIKWDPHASVLPEGFLADCDNMRRKCPVAQGEDGQWHLFRHDDVRRVIQDHETFSNVVSQRVSVPNGMDPPAHTVYRELINPLFTPERMAAFEPECRRIAEQTLTDARDGGNVEVMSALGYPYAARAQCAFLGWPTEMSQPLVDWTIENQHAARLRDRRRLDALGQAFEEIIAKAIQPLREAGDISGASKDLLAARVDGQPLELPELTSIFRNWTVGEIGSLSASVGLILHALAVDCELQQRLREQPALIHQANDEILRVHGPLVSNRRCAMKPAEIRGRHIQTGDMVNVVWVSANRDEEVFEAPEEIRIERDADANLLYGAGIHVCPGAPLARLELRVLIAACLETTERILPAPDADPIWALYPASGFAEVPIIMR